MSKSRILRQLALIAATILFITSTQLVAENYWSVLFRDHSGETLEMDMWNAIKQKRWKEVETKLAPGFQAIHSQETNDRKGELRYLRAQDYRNTQISNINTTESDDLIVVTYTLTTEHSTRGKKLASLPSKHLSVWKKTQGGWQWISHADLSLPQ